MSWQTKKRHTNSNRPSSSLVTDHNIQTIVLINNSITTWPNKILTQLLSFTSNLLQDAYIVFQNGVDNFEISHKTCSNFGLRCSSPLHSKIVSMESDTTKQASIKHDILEKKKEQENTTNSWSWLVIYWQLSLHPLKCIKCNCNPILQKRVQIENRVQNVMLYTCLSMFLLLSQ